MNREDWKAAGAQALDWIKTHPEVVKALAYVFFGVFVGYLLFS